MRRKLSPLVQVLLFVLAALICCGCPESGGGPSNGPSFRSYFVYTANTGSNDVSTFQANKEGKLEFLGKVGAGSAPSDIVYFDSKVFVSNAGDNTISVFTLGQDGRLTLGATVATGTTPLYLAGSKGPPDQHDRLYVSCAGSNEVIRYDIVNTAPYLTEVHRFAVPAPGRATEGINVYIPSNTENKVYQFTLTQSGWIAGTPASLPTGDAPTQVYSSYLGNFVYCLNFFGNSITSFDVSLAGNDPRFVDAGTLPTGTQPVSLTADADSSPTNLYVVNQGIETFSHFSVSLNGELTAVAGTSPSTGPSPTDIVCANNGIQDYKVFAYVTNAGGALRLYQQDGGGLTFVDSYDTNGSNVSAVAVSDFRNSVPLVITTTSLPNGTVGQPYSADLQVEGGVADKAANFQVRSGSLPPGLHFDEAGVGEADRYTRLTGTPTQAGTYHFELAASQPGIGSSRVSYMVIIAPGSVSGDTARFMNASPDAGSATFKIGNLTVASALGYPQMDDAVSISSITDGASHALTLTSTSGAGATGNSTIIAGNSYTFFGLGTHSEAALAIGRRVLPTGYAPPSGKVLITLVDGLQSFPVDLYILQGTDVPSATNRTTTLSFPQTLKIQPEVDAGSYRIFATSQGNPSDIIAQTSLVNIPAGTIADFVLVSPPSQAAQFIVTFEN